MNEWIAITSNTLNGAFRLTEAMEIPNVGCILKDTVISEDGTAVSTTLLPRTTIKSAGLVNYIEAVPIDLAAITPQTLP